MDAAYLYTYSCLFIPMDLLEGYNSYDSDNSEEEDIPASPSPLRHAENNHHQNVDPLSKRRKLIMESSRPLPPPPPLPRGKVTIVDRTNTNTKDGPPLFQRTVPHIRGNWAGHVFICLDDTPLSSYVKRNLRRQVQTSITQFQTQLERKGWNGQIHSHYSPWKNTSTSWKERSSSSSTSNDTEDDDDDDDEDDDSDSSDQINDTPPKGTKKTHGGGGGGQQQRQRRQGQLHVSLSRPFYLQVGSIESFVQDVKERLRGESSTVLHMTSKSCLLVNEDHTRSFYGRTIFPNPSILRWIHHIDQVLHKYQQPPYYHPPLLHTTLASVPGNVVELMAHDTPKENDDDSLTMEEEEEDDDDDDDDPLLISVRRVFCTFGTTKEYVFDLKHP